MKLRIATLAVGSLLVVGCSPIASEPAGMADRPAPIKYGEVDGSAHPTVVLVPMEVAGRPTFTCTTSA